MRKRVKQELLLWVHSVPSEMMEECRTLAYFVGRRPKGYTVDKMWPYRVQAYVNGGLAVHRDVRVKSKWRITHRLSGLTITSEYFESKREAAKVRDRILELTAQQNTTWDFTLDKLDQAGRDLLYQVVRTALGEYNERYRRGTDRKAAG